MQKRALLFQNAEVDPQPSFEVLPGGRTTSKPLPSISLEEFVSYSDEWLSDARSLRQSKATIAGKVDAIAKLKWFLKRINATKFGPREIQRFVSYVAIGHEDAEGRWGNPSMRKPASDRTIEYYFNHVAGFCRWMKNEPFIEVDVDLSHGVRVVKPKQQPIEPFSNEQINELLAAAKRHPFNPKRNYAILLFMLDTGIRSEELCKLKWGDIQLRAGGGKALIARGKGGKPRTVPFSRKAASALWNYVKDHPRDPRDPVFMSSRGKNGKGEFLTTSGLRDVYKDLGKLARIAGVRCSPHTMRHTFAISFLRAGGNTFTLQMLLGHEDLKMTKRYCAIAEADVEDQHRQFSPADRLFDRS